jgi:hypothetical protein
MEFNENCSLVFRKTFQFDADIGGIDYLNHRLLVYGDEFYKIDGGERQGHKTSLQLVRPIRMSQQEYVLCVHENYLVVANKKGMKITKVDGDFS